MTDLILHSGQQHPTLPELRLALRQAMTDAGYLPAWTETYADDPCASPLLLVDGRLVLRLTDWPQLPKVDTLRNLLLGATRPVWQQRLARTGQLSVRFLSALFIAFFPKCPFCWAAYMSYMGATGVVSISYRPWLIWVLVGLLTINVAVLYQTRHRHGLGPFYLCLGGAVLIILNRLWLYEPLLLVLGAVGLLVGSLWNSLSPKMTDSIQFYVQKFS